MPAQDHDDADPYAEGAEAYAAGHDDTANPYPLRTPEHLSWNDGWNYAADLEDDDLEHHFRDDD